MSPREWHQWATWLEIGLGVVTLVSLFFVVAPYGRHVRKGWGPQIPARVGWVVMEAPASLAFLAIYLYGEHRFEPAPLAMLALWQFHYVQRAFVFPFRMKISGKQMPMVIAALAIVFNLLNAYVNARWVSGLGSYPASWLVDPRFLLGTGVFFLGFRINTWADARLASLRKPGESGYVVPHGGLYDRIASPNYFGEIVEWVGWAVLTWSLAGAAFAFYTFANLAPRAVSHLRWYRETFPNYPRDRKAVIPYVW